MAGSQRGVKQGKQFQSIYETITYTVDMVDIGTPTSPSVLVLDVNNNFADVKSTVMPSGSPNIAGNIITLPAMTALTLGRTYLVIVICTISGNITATPFTVEAER